MHRVDSFAQIWNNKKLADTTRLDALDEIAWLYLYTNPDTAYTIAKLESEISLKKNYLESHARSYSVMGHTFVVSGKYDEAVSCYQKAIAIFKKIKSNHGLARSYNSMGIVYFDQGKFRKSLEEYNKSLRAFEKMNDTPAIATMLNNIGLVYFNLNDHNSAEKYFKKAFDLRIRSNHKNGIYSVMSNMASVYLARNDTAKAIKNYKECLEICIEQKNDIGIADILGNLAGVHIEMKEYDHAMKYIQRSFAIREKLEYKSGMSNSLINMATIHYETGNIKAARETGEKAMKLARELDDPRELRGASKVLYMVYKKLNMNLEALLMHESYISTRDSLEAKSNKDVAMRQMYDYEYEKQRAVNKAQYNESLKKQQAVADEEEKRQRIIIWSVSVGLLLVILFSIFLFSRFRVIRKQKELIAVQKAEADLQKELVEEKNKEILDSIQYAKRLQTAILPPENMVKEWVQQSFILFKPKDIVSGDFYWFEKHNGLLYVAAVDCTGHGVPGAMVSVVGHNGLNRALKEFNLKKPADILNKLRQLVEETFSKSEQEVKDGMDVALCCIDLQNRTIEFAGAHNPIWIYNYTSGELTEINGDKQPVGKYQYEKPFTNHEYKLEKNDSIYLFTDGYADQFGGDSGKKYKSSSFKTLIKKIGSQTLDEQKTILNHTFETWRGTHEQLDDVCVIGIRV